MIDPEQSKKRVALGGRDGEPAGFAELVAETALSFLDETGDAMAAASLVEQIVAGAMLLLPGAAAAAVEDVDENGQLYAPVAVGDTVARAVMNAQNDTGQGPCLQVLSEDKQVVVEDLRSDPRWPAFAARAAELGIRSMVCTPMHAADRRVGLLSLMSRTAQFLDEDTATMAAVFAAHAAIAMNGARRVHEMNTALSSRDVIGQAKGILMERFKITADVAFAMLVRTSSLTNLKLRAVCDRLCLTGELPTSPPGRPRSRP